MLRKTSIDCGFAASFASSTLDRNSRLKDSSPKGGLVSPSKPLVLMRSQRVAIELE
jgi:hypothetical protein